MNGPSIKIKPDDSTKILDALNAIEKLPLNLISGEVTIPVHLSTGASFMFVVDGSRECLKRPPIPPPVRDEFTTVLSKQAREKIAQLRASGLLDTEIAKAVGVSPVTIKAWATGENVPRRKDTLHALMHMKELGKPEPTRMVGVG